MNILKKYWWILAIVVVIVAVIIYVVIAKKQKKMAESPAAAQPATISIPASASGSSSYSATVDPKNLPSATFPLKQGMPANKLVWLMQYALNKLHNAGLTLDGDFGPKTAAALKKYRGITTVNQADAVAIGKEFSSAGKSDTVIMQYANMFINSLQ